MEKFLRKYLWVLIVVGAIAGTYYWGGVWLNKIGVNVPGVIVPTSSPSPGGTGGTTAKTIVVKKISTATASPKTYTDLIKTYANTRIQFDINCQAIPGNVTYKNGTTIMLDNRSGDARTITLAGTKIQLAGYGYAIATLRSTVLPKEMLLSCGSAINVGRILLQALILQ